MRKLTIALILIFITGVVYAADTELKDLTAIGDAATDDLIYITDTNDSDNSRKIRVDALLNTGGGLLTGLSDVGSSTQGAGRLLISEGTNFDSIAVSGDVTITSAGVTTIGSEKVDGDELNSTAVSAGTYEVPTITVDADGRLTYAESGLLTGLSDVGSSTQGVGRLLISDGTDFDSIFVGFNPAVTKTVCSSTAINKDYCDYTCDGTDDDVQIQAAIDALGSDGGSVFLSEGTFTISSTITITPDSSQPITLKGGGMGSVIARVNSMNADAIQVTGTNALYWEIKDFQLNGNKANNTSGSGIHITANITDDSRATIENMYIDNFDEHGIEIDNVDIREITFNNVLSYTNDKSGFYLDGSDHKIGNCVAGNNGEHGFYIADANSRYSNTKAFGNGSTSSDPNFYYGFYVLGARNQFSNCQAQDNYTDGFHLDANDIVVSGCLADSNNKDGTIAGTYAGIRLADDADYCDISGNSLVDRGGTAYQDYGIIVDSGVGESLIFGNVYRNNATGQISIASNEIANNRPTFYTRVGIGTSTPNESLEVDGIIQIESGNDDAILQIADERGRVTYDASENALTLEGGSSKGITFHTNASSVNTNERMRIDASGNIGIGTTAPRGKFDVAGSMYVHSQGTVIFDSTANVAIGTTNPGELLSIHGTEGKVYIRDDSNAIDVMIGSDGSTPFIRGGAGDVFHLGSDGSHDDLVIGINGDVGIGTTAPSQKLQVAGHLYVSSSDIFIDDNTALKYGDGTVEIRGHSTQDWINFEGANVGIGTTAPGTKLEVNGTINATAIQLGGNPIDLADLNDVGVATQGAGRLLISDGTDFESIAMSGDCTIKSDGDMTCSSAGQLTDMSDVGSSTQGAGRLLISDGTDFDSIAMSGACTIKSNGVIVCEDTKEVYIEDPTTADDLESIIDNEMSGNWDVQSVWGESDGTVTFMFSVDDGSPSVMDTSYLSVDSSRGKDSSLDGDTVVESGERVDLTIDTVTGSPTWFKGGITIKY